METEQIMLRPTAPTKFPLNQNDTDNLDDTLPVELLDCVDTTTNNDWLTRDTPFFGKHSSAPKLHASERAGSSMFNPPLSSTRYQSDGSSDISDVSTTAEFGSTCCDDTDDLSTGPRVDLISPPFLAPSMEFQPLRCSTDVTNDELLKVKVDTFQIRVDTNEFKSLRVDPQVDGADRVDFNPLRCSTGLVNNENAAVNSVAVHRNESMEFNPLRCSTGLVNQDDVKSTASDKVENFGVNPVSYSKGSKTEKVVEKPFQIRPGTPDHFYVTACNTFNNQNTVRESDNTHFVTAFSCSHANGTGTKSEKNAKSPTVQVSESEYSAAQKSADKVDNDLSILMQCHLKIRNGRQLVSNLQAKPHIELSVFKNSPIDSGGPSVIPKAFSTGKQYFDQSNKRCQTTHNGLWVKPPRGKVRVQLKENVVPNFPAPSAIPTEVNLPGPNDILRDKLIRENAPKIVDDRQAPESWSVNRIERAMDSLASANIQKMIPALAILNTARSAPVCEKLVQRGLVDNVYDFLSKMNRSVVHQVACKHATSLLLDLAKYTYSKESVWQNGERIGLLFNLMLIWVSKDSAIFLNCATILWVFSQETTHAKVLQQFVASQNRLLEKISVKLGSKIQRPTSKEPSLMPSWTALGVPRTYENTHFGFSGLSAALKRLPTREK